MVKSIALLDLAVGAIEQWSQIQLAQYGETRIGYRSGYLNNTSYSDTHSQTDHRYIDSERVLFDAIEAAILNHAKKHSNWWLENRERLCFSHEGSLCYFAIIALTKNPQVNCDLIGQALCNRDLLEFSLSYELGMLIHSSFIHIDDTTQDTVMETIGTLWKESEPDEKTHFWALKNQAKYISYIPCYLRSPTVQGLLEIYEKTSGASIRQPSIDIHGGTISAPFAFEVFLTARDDGVIRLLKHYSGHSRDYHDFLVGGEREVGSQLSEASSRHPSRFLTLMTERWDEISEEFRDEIMEGAATYLAICHGSLQANGNREQVVKVDSPALVSQILDELEKHPAQWRFNRSSSKALEACAHVIQDFQNAERLVFLAIGFVNHREENSYDEATIDLENVGINMTTGNIVEALMILATNLHEKKIRLPKLLSPTLLQFAGHEHPAIRALILRRLPYLQSQDPKLGWNIFLRATQNSANLWKSAERCLYYAYHKNFEKVEPSLQRIRSEGSKDDMETWGRISALSAFRGHIDHSSLLEELKVLKCEKAWLGAATVWTNTGNIKQNREQCIKGIEAGLNESHLHAMAVAKQVANIFHENSPPVFIPIELIRLFFSVFERDSENKQKYLFGFNEWLNATSQRDPQLALDSAEVYLTYVRQANSHFYDHDNHLVQLLTRLFAEAEEREESDQGAMLKQVVLVQDLLLSLGGNAINEWLKVAER